MMDPVRRIEPVSPESAPAQLRTPDTSPGVRPRRQVVTCVEEVPHSRDPAGTHRRRGRRGGVPGDPQVPENEADVTDGRLRRCYLDSLRRCGSRFGTLAPDESGGAATFAWRPR